MKRFGMFWSVCLSLAGLFLACTPDVQAQDLFREVNQLKKEVADLKQEVGDLRNLAYELRRAMLQQGRQTEAKEVPKEETAAKQTPPPDEEELTRIICQAVGKFFVEADNALRARDSSVATSEMKKALNKLNTALQGYSGTHRVYKLLNIYEGLAWSTYTAVQMRESVAGNDRFIEVLNKHKQRYKDTCPKR